MKCGLDLAYRRLFVLLQVKRVRAEPQQVSLGCAKPYSENLTFSEANDRLVFAAIIPRE